MKMLAMAALLGLVGCAQQWIRAGASEEDLRRDAATCRAQAVAAAPPDGSATSYIAMRAIDEKCMEGKGWKTK